MKANIKTVKSKNNILLTIGMIVKNEEKVICQCLDAVRRLMAMVPSELIITDTGSTDNTVELASKYTDNITHYEWNDDFAAARNVAVDMARGEWFMFIDADETMNDELISSIAEFFKGDKRKSYNTCAIIINNIISTIGDDRQLSRACRLGRMIGKERRFKSPIHEYFPQVDPIIELNGELMHTGYMGKGGDKLKLKSERNDKILLKQLELEPDSIHLLYQYAVGGGSKKHIDAMKRARELVDVAKDPYMLNEIYTGLASRLMNSGEAEEAERLCCVHLAREGLGAAALLDTYYTYTQVLNKLNKWEECLVQGQKYLDCYTTINKGEVELGNFESIFRNNIGSHNDVLMAMANSKLMLKAIDDSMGYVMDACFNVSVMQAQMMYDNALTLLKALKDGTWLPVFYGKIHENSDKKWIQDCVHMLSSYMMDMDIARQIIAAMEQKYKDSAITYALKAYCYGFDDNMQKPEDMADAICSEGCECLLVAACALHKVNLEPILLKMQAINIENAAYAIIRIGDTAQSFFEENILPLTDNADVRTNLFIMLTLEALENIWLDNEKAQNKPLYVHTIISAYRAYAKCVYSNDALYGEASFMLPEKYKFALILENKIDIAAIKTALGECPKCFKLADILLDELSLQVQEKAEKQEADKSEWETLAYNIKQSIYNMITDGKLLEAKDTIAQYKKVAPTDEEIPEMEKKLLRAEKPAAKKPS
ncbi:MAG: glycosyltransferase [Oscillospiraceae bacterium]